MSECPMPPSPGIRLAAVLLCSLATASAQTPPLPPPADQQLAHDIYKQFIEIKSGYTSGATTPVAEAAAARLRAAGFPDSDIFLGGPIPTKQNIVVRLHGSGANKPILLLAHEDVVEANRADWSADLDPYVFTEKDGYFYGRGTSDDKDQAAVWSSHGLIRMKRENFVPDRDIIVALTADEEGGGPYSGIQWLIKNHRDLIDAEFALNEGGYGELSPTASESPTTSRPPRSTWSASASGSITRVALDFPARPRQRHLSLPRHRTHPTSPPFQLPTQNQRRHRRLLPPYVHHRNRPRRRVPQRLRPRLA